MLQNAPKSTAEKALRGTSDKDARFPQQRSKNNKRIDSAKKKKKHQVRTQLRREKSIQEGESNSQALPINISGRDKRRVTTVILYAFSSCGTITKYNIFHIFPCGKRFP